MTVEELFTKWGFDVNLGPLKALEKTVDSVADRVNRVGIGVAAAAGTLFGFAKFTANAGDEALRLSTILGVSVEGLQRLQFAAKLGNVSSEELGTGLRFLNKNLIDARKGTGEAADAFRRLRLDPKQIKDSEQGIKLIADRFRTLPEGPERSALAMRLFGRSGAALVPLLNEGSAAIDEAAAKAERYGIVLTRAEAIIADRFNDTLDESRAALTGVRNVIGNQLIPQIIPLLEAFNDFVATNRAIIAQKLGAFFQTLSKVIRVVYVSIQGAIGIIQRLAGAFGGLGGVLAPINQALDFALANPRFLGILGAVTAGVYALATAFAVANSAALVIPLAIAAVIAGIALLVDDFAAFSRGEDSVIGSFINYFKTEFPKTFAVGQGAIELFVAGFKLLYEAVNQVLSALVALNDMLGGALLTALEKLGKVIAKILGVDLLFNLGVLATKAIQNNGSVPTSSQGPINRFTPMSAPLVSGQGIQEIIEMSMQNTNNITIQAAPGTDVRAVGEAAKGGVEAAMDETMRKTKRSLRKGVEY